MGEQHTNFVNTLLEKLCTNLDISETLYKKVAASYEAVGSYLAEAHSALSAYRPEIRPQGSFMLGTMIMPVNPDDELDIDLVCQLTGKDASWTQYDLKRAVGRRLKEHLTYHAMLRQPEGRRCWTLAYPGEASYHMDILPCVTATQDHSSGRSFSRRYGNYAEEPGLRITDNLTDHYKTEMNSSCWQKSNPFGYAHWFFQQASMRRSRSVQPVSEYQATKLPLQRIVQLLKRHRDIMFGSDEKKPISPIITTLAARAYEGQENIAQGLLEVTQRMAGFISQRYSGTDGRMIKWIENPVNPEENFADKWNDEGKEECWNIWLRQVHEDMQQALSCHDAGEIQTSLARTMGADPVIRAFKSMGTSL